MPPASLKLKNTPDLTGGTLLLALTGWMDGGDVSTGTVKQLMDGRKLVDVARIDSTGFYIENFPGSMEVSALFRPHVKYSEGLVEEFEMSSNRIYADPQANMAFFIGREPNMNWVKFGDCIFKLCAALKLKRIIFMGSFGGTVPHTREPRLFGAVSEIKLAPLLRQFKLSPTEYEGPGSFATYLLTRAKRHKLEMISIAVEIPGYLQGPNPLSIEAVTRRLSAMLNLQVDFARLRKTSTRWEMEVSEAVEKDTELAETVRKLEEQYDNELIEQPES